MSQLHSVTIISEPFNEFITQPLIPAGRRGPWWSVPSRSVGCRSWGWAQGCHPCPAWGCESPGQRWSRRRCRGWPKYGRWCAKVCSKCDGSSGRSGTSTWLQKICTDFHTSYYDCIDRTTRHGSSMILSARPTILPLVNIVCFHLKFVLFC